MIPAAFEYHAPTTMRQALNLLRRHPGETKLLAGGQSLLPVMRMRLSQPAHIVDLGQIPNLNTIEQRDDGLAIGPMATYFALESSPLVQHQALAEASSQIADLQVRNRGTLGGSIANADPAADLTAVAIALEARVRVSGFGRTKSVPVERFFVDVFTTTLGDSEIIREIFIPTPPAHTGSAYQKFGNKASHFAIVGVAALVNIDPQGICRKVRVGVTGATRHSRQPRVPGATNPGDGREGLGAGG